MGCNCNKPVQQFKELVQQANTTSVSVLAPLLQLPPPITRAERIRLRNEGVAARSKAREARSQARKAALEKRKLNG